MGYQKIQLYTFLGSNLSHVSYQLGKGCCLPILPQYFAHNLYNAFVAQWWSFRLKILTFFASWKAPGSNPGGDQHFWSFFVKYSAAFSRNFSIRNTYYFCKSEILPKGNLSETF